jgi:lysozyme
MDVSPRGIALIQRFEGLRLTAYLDSVDKPTIGYGSTKGVRMGDEITQAQAVELLAADVERHADGVRRLVDVPLTQNQFDALVSLVFNIGVGAFRRSTLLRKLNAGDHRGAADELLRWTKAGGRELRGLVRRREAERALFLEPEPPSHWYDEVDAQPNES